MYTPYYRRFNDCISYRKGIQFFVKSVKFKRRGVVQLIVKILQNL